MGFAQSQKEPLVIRVYYLPHCGACIKVKNDVIPPVARIYGDRVRWQYIDISDQVNYSRFLLLEKTTKRSLGTPTVVVGNNVLMGLSEVADRLVPSIDFWPHPLPWNSLPTSVDMFFNPLFVELLESIRLPRC